MKLKKSIKKYTVMYLRKKITKIKIKNIIFVYKMFLYATLRHSLKYVSYIKKV